MTSATPRQDLMLCVVFAAAVLAGPILLAPLGAGYPDLLQKFAIFGLFAIGFNILFGLTGYLSFGHAAFLGVGSYTAVWSFKLLTMNVIPAVLSRGPAGRPVLLPDRLCQPAPHGDLLLHPDPRVRPDVLQPRLFGAHPDHQWRDRPAAQAHRPQVSRQSVRGRCRSRPAVDQSVRHPDDGYGGFYFCAVLLIVGFYVAMRITRSPFGMMLKAIKSNQNRMNYTGFNTRPYMLAAFVISGMYAGLAGSLLAVTDPLAGAERMQWTASGEVVLMTILGGAGTLLGPVIGAGIIKYFENIFSAFNERTLEQFFSFLPDGLDHAATAVSSMFVGEGWQLTLGMMFVLVVVFLPGGLMQGLMHIWNRLFGERNIESADRAASAKLSAAE